MDQKKTEPAEARIEPEGETIVLFIYLLAASERSERPGGPVGGAFLLHVLRSAKAHAHAQVRVHARTHTHTHTHTHTRTHTCMHALICRSVCLSCLLAWLSVCASVLAYPTLPYLTHLAIRFGQLTLPCLISLELTSPYVSLA